MSLELRRFSLIAGLLCLELVVLAVAYQLLVAFECQSTRAAEACRLLGSLVARAIAVFAAATVIIWARPGGLALLLSADPLPASQRWPLLHFLGVALILAPLAVAYGQPPAAFFAMALGPWLVGAAAAATGALFWLAPPRAWGRWLFAERGTALVVLAIAFFIPDVAELVQPVWDSSDLTRLTFSAVERLLSLVSPLTQSDPANYIIGVEPFFVHIARQCSGVEGFALVGGFVLLYAFLFRQQTRLPRYWLVVLPAALALSWALNVLRITALILIGARVSPELAVDGFHSYAGWMFFTLLALALLVGVQAIPWLRVPAGTEARGPAPAPLVEDWDAARILPFVAFMGASVVASALAPVPDLAYPLKALAMVAALAVFHRVYRRIEAVVDPLAIGAGAAVGVVWVLLSPAAGPEPSALANALSGLGIVAFVLWAAIRILGTVVLVPVVEELFFRGYLLVRLDRGGLGWRIVALAISSGSFAALHGRWAEALMAGLVFGLLMIRRGRIADPIAAHVTANLIVAGWAVARNDWGAI